MAPRGGGPGSGDKPPGVFDVREFGHDLDSLKEAAKSANDEGREWGYVLVTYKEKK